MRKFPQLGGRPSWARPHESASEVVPVRCVLPLFSFAVISFEASSPTPTLRLLRRRLNNSTTLSSADDPFTYDSTGRRWRTAAVSQVRKSREQVLPCALLQWVDRRIVDKAINSADLNVLHSASARAVGVRLLGKCTLSCRLLPPALIACRALFLRPIHLSRPAHGGDVSKVKGARRGGRAAMPT